MHITCLHFGDQASLYIVNQAKIGIMEFATGRQGDDDLEFQWDQVVLNLTTMVNCDP